MQALVVTVHGLSSGVRAQLLSGMWDSSSRNRDWIHVFCIGRQILNQGSPCPLFKTKKKKVFKVRIKFAFILKTSYWKLLITLKRQNCSLSFCLCLVFISSDTLILLISWCEKSGALLLDLWYLGLLPPALSLDGNQKHQIWGASLPQVRFECKRLGSQCFMGWSNCVPEF